MNSTETRSYSSTLALIISIIAVIVAGYAAWSVRELSNTIAGATTQISDVASQQGTAASDLSSVRDATAELEAALGEAREAVSAARGEIESLAARIDALEQSAAQ